jgi:hypothetical protein
MKKRLKNFNNCVKIKAHILDNQLHCDKMKYFKLLKVSNN